MKEGTYFYRRKFEGTGFETSYELKAVFYCKDEEMWEVCPMMLYHRPILDPPKGTDNRYMHQFGYKKDWKPDWKPLNLFAEGSVPFTAQQLMQINNFIADVIDRFSNEFPAGEVDQ